jgi:hypothetical protein
MGNYFEPVLSEEQMAAYLDGMLSTEESNMVEEVIDSNPEMVEIQDVIDSVDNTFLYVTNDEIPIECLADDFSLPDIGHGEDYHANISYDTNYDDTDSFNEEQDNQDNVYDTEYIDESSISENDDSFLEDGYNDISF